MNTFAIGQKVKILDFASSFDPHIFAGEFGEIVLIKKNNEFLVKLQKEPDTGNLILFWGSELQSNLNDS